MNCDSLVDPTIIYKVCSTCFMFPLILRMVLIKRCLQKTTKRCLQIVSGYSGTAGDAFNAIPSYMANNNMVFSTKDSDNDNNIVANCADSFKGGWWYNACHNCQLNGLFPSWLYVMENN